MQATKTPRAELEAQAREQYRQHFGAAPTKVRNAKALVSLGEHRALRWRGHGYTVPPLQFSLGAQMLVVQQTLEANESSVKALRLARRLLHAVVRTRRGRRPMLNPFRRIAPGAAKDLITSLLHVPDESPQTGSDSGQTIDLMDGLLEFVRMFPAWVGADGLPVSWAMYQYGIRHIDRAVARDTLRIASATRVAQSAKTAFQAFASEQRSAAGWN